MYTFPKSQMRLKELMKMGYSQTELQNAYRTPGQTFARKINPSKKGSPIVFDTEGLRLFLEKKSLETSPVPERMVI